MGFASLYPSYLAQPRWGARQAPDHPILCEPARSAGGTTGASSVRETAQ